METENLLPAFYKDGHILITGATGFLGKALIEKLLRCCPDVSKLYLLIRCKKGKNPDERLNELFRDPAFQRLPTDSPSFREKIKILPGDCGLPWLGLDPEYVKLIQKTVTVVFHGAATVKFDENLKIAYAINVGGTKEIIQICHKMEKLKAIIHVSTAFSHPYLPCIEEKFYEPPLCTLRIEQMVQALTPEEIDTLTPALLEKWPNTYTLTKAMAEYYVKSEEGKLPICVYRPPIVISSAHEPIPGWIDNVYGPIGVLGAAMLGYLKVIWADIETVAHVLPIDLVINGLLLVARETYNSLRCGNQQVTIYNHDTGKENPLTWKDYKNFCLRKYPEVPSEKAIWYGILNSTKYYYLFLTLSFFLHYLPAYFMDGLTKLLGKKPRMVKAYDKLVKVVVALSYFSTSHSKIENNNLRELAENTSERDLLIFNTDVKKLDWQEYFSNYVRGYRNYILKETRDNLPQAIAKNRRLYWIHTVTKCLVFYGIAHFVYLCCI